MPSDPICGAATNLGPASVAVCERSPYRHAALDHRDLGYQVSWPICDAYCPAVRKEGDPPARHVCGRYRGDTAARYDDA